LYRTSTRSSARTIHYYRCLGSDAWRRLSGSICNNRPVRQDLLDEVVWTEIVRLLEDPRLIQNEIERRLAAAREADPTKRREEGLRRDVVRIRKSIDRLLTAYQEGLLPIEELRERMPQLRRRQQASNAELQAIADQSVTRTAYLRLAETLNTFLTRLRSSASALDVSERQRIVRLLVKEVLVGDDKIIIRHCIPLPNRSDDGDGPSTARINAAPAGTEGYLLRSRSHLAVARQYLPVLRARPVRRALATARGCGRRDHRALCRRLHRRFRARGRRSALPGPAARADGEVRAGASPGEDPADRVRPPRGGKPPATRARQTGNLQLPGLHLHLRNIPPGPLPDQTEVPARPHAGETPGGQAGAALADASADPRARGNGSSRSSPATSGTTPCRPTAMPWCNSGTEWRPAGDSCSADAARRAARLGPGLPCWWTTGFPDRASSILGPTRLRRHPPE